jgi:membrane protease YdiL (CAAX protease family)
MDAALKPNWRHVGAFLGLTFGLTWLLDLAVYLRGGLQIPGIVATLQLQMLLPAFSAIVLGLFFFPESPIYRKRSAGRGRWFYYYFLLLTLVYAIGAVVAWFSPAPGTVAVVSTIPLVLALLGLLFLVVLRFIAGREAMARVWLSWGKARYYVLFGLGIVGYYLLQAALNGLFGLGETKLAPAPASLGLSQNAFVIVAVLQSVVLAPLLAIVIAFGEEYGWRGYLQNELFKLGRVRGVLLLGVIWGAWHWPLILMGYNYPGHPLLGMLLMVLYTIGLGVVLSYAVLRSGSVLLAAYLHALNNQIVATLIALGFRPFDMAFSFDIGLYGVVTLAVVVILILRDPIWRARGNVLPEGSPEQG